MALQTSGQISLNDIHVEAGGSSGTQASLNDSDIRGLIDKGSGAQMAFNEWYGATAAYQISSNSTTIRASDIISSGDTIKINSGVYLYGNFAANTNTPGNDFYVNGWEPALIVDVNCTIINDGYIIGKGAGFCAGDRLQNSVQGRGDSNYGYYSFIDTGGPAIWLSSSSITCTIQNNSGAYIAGGGGSNDTYAGGGAGGGNSMYSPSGNGGAPGYAGGNGTGAQGGTGGGAGGGGGGCTYTGAYGSYGGGGGRILPGSGGVGGANYAGNTASNPGRGVGGNGGGAGNPGYDSGMAIGQAGVVQYPLGAGGGGWGAKGGRWLTVDNYYSPNPGRDGGYAIYRNGGTLNLTNNGTIYGATT